MKVELQLVLKRELKSRNWTINGLARQCGIPASVLHGWVQGVLPSAKNLHHIGALATCLKMPLALLLFNHRESDGNATMVFTSEFNDGPNRYRFSLEKIGTEDGS